MESLVRNIFLYMNSPDQVEVANNLTWGELKNKLVNEKNYANNIIAIDDETGIRYDNDETLLPEGDISLSILVLNTKYGK